MSLFLKCPNVLVLHVDVSLKILHTYQELTKLQIFVTFASTNIP